MPAEYAPPADERVGRHGVRCVGRAGNDVKLFPRWGARARANEKVTGRPKMPPACRCVAGGMAEKFLELFKQHT